MGMTAKTDEDALTATARQVFGAPVPHLEEMGVAVVETAPERLTLRLPYRPCLIGDSEAELLHSGAVTSLADTACGFLAMTVWPAPRTVATLDLRMDFLRPALAGQDLFVEARCLQRTRHVVFVRAKVYQADPEVPVALATGTFMLTDAEAGA